MPFFTKFGSGVERHIWHTHSEEMSQKSEIVSTYMNVCYLKAAFLYSLVAVSTTTN